MKAYKDLARLVQDMRECIPDFIYIAPQLKFGQYICWDEDTLAILSNKYLDINISKTYFCIN